MSRFSARFFSYVQSAAFYRELHDRAVHLLPSGEGKIWFDVGTGPGLVARDASAHGYRSAGFDIDPAMVEQAREISRRSFLRADFQVAGIDDLLASGRKADVVSAASLLAVLNDKHEALHRLMACVNDGGTLLIIETTHLMKPGNAWVWLRKNGFGKRNWILLLWAWARVNGPAVNPQEMQLRGYQIEHFDVFEGMVSAWLIRRDP
jgi:ubiquinone/menaquinone biosynthesis C-methylase UbiE